MNTSNRFVEFTLAASSEPILINTNIIAYATLTTKVDYVGLFLTSSQQILFVKENVVEVRKLLTGG